jgi:hypothetical protein
MFYLSMQNKALDIFYFCKSGNTTYKVKWIEKIYICLHKVDVTSERVCVLGEGLHYYNIFSILNVSTRKNML